MKRSVKKILSAMFVGCMLLSTTVMGAGAIVQCASVCYYTDRFFEEIKFI